MYKVVCKIRTPMIFHKDKQTCQSYMFGKLGLFSFFKRIPVDIDAFLKGVYHVF